MSNHYAYAHAAYVYAQSPVSPTNVPHIVVGAQYSPHSPSANSNSNGLYPGYLPPYPVSPSVSVLHMPNPLAKPPAAGHYHVDHNGWYNPPYHHPSEHSVPSSTSAPLHPPGLAIPLHRMPTSPRETSPSTVPASTSPSSDTALIHEHWKGRLAPLPGYRSRPILLPKKESLPVRPEIVSKQVKEESSSELLPPHSFFGSDYERKSTPTLSPASSDPSTLSDAKCNQKNDKTTKEFQFDAYAEAYIPQYLFDIQKQTYSLKPLPAIPLFPPMKYLQSFLIPRLIEESLSVDNLSLLKAAPLPQDFKAPILAKDTYYHHWVDILRWELDAIVHKKEQIVLWRTGLKVVNWKDAEFSLEVPGIRENHPHLEIGDLVHMREVLDPGQQRSRWALEGRVAVLRKREGLVHISSLPLKEHIQTYVPLTLETTKTENGFVVLGPEDVIPFYFNISFMTNARPLCTMENAVTYVANNLNTEEAGVNLAKQWVFPQVEDFNDAPSAMLLEGGIEESQWTDSGLNPEQRLAVTSVALYQSPVPHLICGPPGTGKTRTVVEAVMQIFKIQPEACILLCAPSNPATDTLALRLQKHLSQNEMLRLNDPNRTFAEVPDIIKPYCFVENDKFSIPPFKKLMQYRVVVCSCLDASILVKAQCTNSRLMVMEDEVTVSLHPNREPKHVVQPHWTHLLIDEAAQGSEPELLVPISVVLPNIYNPEIIGKTFMPQLTLCGDPNQLGPIVASDEARSAEFEVSLLERLSEVPLYAQYAQQGNAHRRSSQRLPPLTSLVKNYRSHPVILMPPSAIFYNDSLEPCAVNGKIFWPGLSKPEFPLKFIGTEALEKSNDERASWYNLGQISIVLNIIRSLLDNSKESDPPLRPSEISVMAPWRKQVWTLRERLRNEGFGAVDVGTVEDYQGRENRVVIISCVRSSARFLEEDFKKGMGLIFERKRMNVAITRAKELLVVIGNGSLLLRDPYWKSFLQFVIRNGLYEGPELPLEMDGNYVSRLESDLFRSDADASELEPETQGLLLAGGLAREVLRE